ncbi:hypothetical protein CC030809_00054 [Synechococcus phage S-CAM7]|uniref:Uncharacterized protein n=1 Tax=Synechococcus phage S-CAM7 TaxID=1883368 RepID=A0A7D5JUT7_9CAUD|nr:hypothetical protein CC030809_00054 [Synechococcus phage S-CAM7]
MATHTPYNIHMKQPTIDLSRFESDFQGVVSPLQNSIPSVRLYEWNLADYAAKQVELAPEEAYASWIKSMDRNAMGDGLRSAAYWRGFYDILIGKNWEYESLALENSIGSMGSVMQFIPPHANGQAGAASMVVEIAKAALGQKYHVKFLSGADNVKNETAEREAEDALIEASRVGKKVWFISQGMACRSFSVPEIDTVLLTYDGGAMGATIQKLSRACTAGEVDKLAKVVAISIDPNRDDKLTGFILDAAVKASEENETDLNEELRRAHATFPLFTQHGDAFLPISEDEYLKRAMKLSSVKRLAVSREALINIDPAVAMDLVEQFNSNVSPTNRAGTKDVGIKGSRFQDTPTPKAKVDDNEEQKAMNRLQEQLTAFVEHVEFISYLVDEEYPSIDSILSSAELNDQNSYEFQELAGMMPNVVRQCLGLGLLSRTWIDSTILASRQEHTN